MVLGKTFKITGRDLGDAALIHHSSRDNPIRYELAQHRRCLRVVLVVVGAHVPNLLARQSS